MKRFDLSLATAKTLVIFFLALQLQGCGGSSGESNSETIAPGNNQESNSAPLDDSGTISGSVTWIMNLIIPGAYAKTMSATADPSLLNASSVPSLCASNITDSSAPYAALYLVDTDNEESFLCATPIVDGQYIFDIVDKSQLDGQILQIHVMKFNESTTDSGYRAVTIVPDFSSKEEEIVPIGVDTTITSSLWREQISQKIVRAEDAVRTGMFASISDFVKETFDEIKTEIDSTSVEAALKAHQGLSASQDLKRYLKNIFYPTEDTATKALIDNTNQELLNKYSLYKNRSPTSSDTKTAAEKDAEAKALADAKIEDNAVKQAADAAAKQAEADAAKQATADAAKQAETIPAGRK
ncbi:MAG: hypothetical protein KBD63_02380 [Bacteriovoracaceae bacterium]|nr:hypothetical protein [Bacteriovoracaceae bacterium]